MGSGTGGGGSGTNGQFSALPSPSIEASAVHEEGGLSGMQHGFRDGSQSFDTGGGKIMTTGGMASSWASAAAGAFKK